MGKGANYLNNNKGVFLQASKKKKSKNESSMPMCEYGAGCTRPKCIYRHPTERDPSYYHQSKEPCMAFLAGVCAFDANGCRKRHPPKEEKEALIARYKRTKCRFGDDCQTRGCLYQHPSDEPEEQAQPQLPAQPLMAAWGPPLQQQGFQTAGTGVGPTYNMPPLHQAYYHSHQQQLYQRQQQQQYVPFPQQQQLPPAAGVAGAPPQPMAHAQHLASSPPAAPTPPSQSQPNANAAEFVPGKPYVPSADAPAFVPGSQWRST